MSARTNIFHKVTVTRQRNNTPHPSKAAKAQGATSANGPRKLTPPRPPPRSSPALAPSPLGASKKRKIQHEDNVEEAPLPPKKRAQGPPQRQESPAGAQDEEDGDDAPPPPKKRTKGSQRQESPEDTQTVAPRKAKAGKKAKIVSRDDDDDDNEVVDIDPDLLHPTWADPLVELDARASQATRLKEKYYNVYLYGRLIERLRGFSASYDEIISYAVSMHGVAPDDRPANQGTRAHPDDTIELVHHVLLDWFPDWDKAVPILKKDPSLIAKLATYLGKVGGKTRSDDLVRLKKQVVWAAGIDDPKGRLAAKRNRGFNHLGLARMLCPKSKLEQFDEDPEKFCQDVLDGKEKLRSCDWWAGLYDLELARPGEFRPGLLMSDFGVYCYLILFCSYNSSDFETTTNKKKKGQPSLARKYGLQQVTLMQIIYTMCLARFCITDIADWTPVDGAWSVNEFAKSILDFAHKNPNWHFKLIKWWTRRVYGAAHNEVMAQEEYEQTAFYIAMNFEGDDDDDNEFEDRPRRIVKPQRAAGPVKRTSPRQHSSTPRSPPQISATPVHTPRRRPGQTQIRRMTTPPLRPRHLTTPGSQREKTDPRSLETYWDEEIANAAEPPRAFWDDQSDAEKPQPFWDDENPTAAELEQQADPDASEDDAEGSQGTQDEEDEETTQQPAEHAKRHSQRLVAESSGEDQNETGWFDEERRAIALPNEERHGVGWHAEQDGTTDWEDDTPDVRAMKMEREGTAGPEVASAVADDEGMNEDAGPAFSGSPANDQEDARDTNTMDGAPNHGSKAGSPGAGTPSGLKAQLAALLADGVVTDEDLGPEEQEMIAKALAQLAEKAKAKAVEEKKRRNKEKVMMAKKRAALAHRG